MKNQFNLILMFTSSIFLSLFLSIIYTQFNNSNSEFSKLEVESVNNQQDEFPGFDGYHHEQQPRTTISGEMIEYVDSRKNEEVEDNIAHDFFTAMESNLIPTTLLLSVESIFNIESIFAHRNRKFHERIDDLSLKRGKNSLTSDEAKEYEELLIKKNKDKIELMYRMREKYKESFTEDQHRLFNQEVSELEGAIEKIKQSL
ncbi:hypothetical protein [Leptospira sp. GIMC2001]|uniref:hypothetical protein n=1 Tax=Leptospira sp. GIMC2001 TaxID=1513297 RepID=UPI002349FE93|nr:hypothetical protein [Leptospira sp. GIMC2001]WCL50170.1 hypothetical protein O4O04_04955 [Leptospira sp. GIMC2001]